MIESYSKNDTVPRLLDFISCLLSARFIKCFKIIPVFPERQCFKSPYFRGLKTRDFSTQPSFTWIGFSAKWRCEAPRASSHLDVRWKWCCQTGLRYLQSTKVVKTPERCQLPLWPFSHEHIYKMDKIMTKHIKLNRNRDMYSVHNSVHQQYIRRCSQSFLYYIISLCAYLVGRIYTIQERLSCCPHTT